LATHRLHLKNVNWLGDVGLDALAGASCDIFARVRSTRPPTPARLGFDHGRCFVDLGQSEAGVAPGQACVFYDGGGAGARILGGGWIARAERCEDAERALDRLMAGERATLVA
jgi:tRNA-specific 2-thiouridylase